MASTPCLGQERGAALGAFLDAGRGAVESTSRTSASERAHGRLSDAPVAVAQPQPADQGRGRRLAPPPATMAGPASGVLDDRATGGTSAPLASNRSASDGMWAGSWSRASVADRLGAQPVHPHDRRRGRARARRRRVSHTSLSSPVAPRRKGQDERLRWCCSGACGPGATMGEGDGGIEERGQPLLHPRHGTGADRAASAPSRLPHPYVDFRAVFNVTGGELAIILLVALIVLGPDKLPDAIRKVGRVYGELRRDQPGLPVRDPRCAGQARPPSTLFRAILGELRPTTGSVTAHARMA